MSLNIKNQRVYDLASELARISGQSMTSVVLDALIEQRKRLLGKNDVEKRVGEFLAIAERCAKHIRQPFRSTEHGDMLYDESGMPQ
ncbi:MAG: type II toxin-antitoxin system VapB family antitoxin [Chloroflexi bacterium]|nr:type II toxin-antitoxin system VapB family antitoxin [Chloroflexota bacterium]